MSMIGNLVRIQNETLLKLRQSPESITAFLYPGRPMVQPASPGFFSRLFGKKPPPPEPPKTITPLPPLAETDLMDLDKAWHALHFLFTGSDWEGDFPQGFLVSCGQEIGDVDVGYGPARSFSPDEVEKISKFLDSQNESDLRKRLDPKKMAELEIYPSIWSDKTNLDEEWEYFGDGFQRMKEFVKETAAKRMALLIYLN
jgi:hypothetical protein